MNREEVCMPLACLIRGAVRALYRRTVWITVLLAGLTPQIISDKACAQSPTAIGATDPAKYLDDVKTLSSPEMEGRWDGSRGLVLAERFLVERYKSLGLDPAGSKGYLQPFRVVTGRKILDGTKVSGQA